MGGELRAALEEIQRVTLYKGEELDAQKRLDLIWSRARDALRLAPAEEVDRYLLTVAQRDRLAGTLRLLRDTTSDGSYVNNAATRALEEAGIPDPEDDDGCC